MTKKQIKQMRKMAKAMNRELKNVKSSRRRFIISDGLEKLETLLCTAEKRFGYQSARTTVRERVEFYLKDHEGINQLELLRVIRKQTKRYQTNPNFSSYFSNVMARVRDQPPAWLGFGKYGTKWEYWDNRVTRNDSW